MNIVAKSDFNFQGKALVPVSNITGTWLTSSDLAKALEYSNSRAVTMIYNKYADEFSSGMTQVLEVSTSGNYRKKVRVFSLRGAHLVAMFARTDVAKEFRRWVLDILDREVVHSPIAKQFTDDELYDLACLWSVSQIIRSDAKIVKAAMELVDSPIAKKISKNDSDIEYFSNKARNVLLRESQHIAKMANPGLGWKTELNRLNGKGELH
ncbi:BRO-N domain-containing protein [Serratia fonticola]